MKNNWTSNLNITVFFKSTVKYENYCLLDEILCGLVPIYQTTCLPIPEGNKLAMRSSNLTNKL